MTKAATVPAKNVETVPGPSSITLIDLLRAAVDKGADVGTLERLAKLYESAEAREAKKAFDLALAEAKKKIKPLLRDKQVNKKDSTAALYRYETFASIAEAIDPILSEHGLYYTFPDPSSPIVDRKANHIYVTCRLSHRDGYFIESTKDGPPDIGQNRNAMQAIGSSNQYLQRYALKAVLGLAVAQDTDGKARQQQPAPSNEPVNANTGEILEADKPQLIEGGANVTWQDWTRLLLMMINDCKTVEQINQWLEKNAENMGKLLMDLPQHHQFVMREVTKRQRKLGS